MTYVAHLDLALNNSLRNKARMRYLFLEEGAEIRDHTGSAAAVREFIDNAVSMMLWNETFLTDEQLRSCIQDAVRSGKRLLVSVNQNVLPILNTLLDGFHVVATSVGIADPAASSATSIALRRLKHAQAFRDEELLHGVEEVVISQPRLLKYGGDAAPVLVIPVEDAIPIDFALDLRVEWTSPDITCVVRSQPVGFEGEVLVVSGGLFFDPFTTSTGGEVRGVSANEPFCRNVARWLLGAEVPPSASATRAFQMVDRIERLLVDFSTAVLKEHFDDWWSDGVPLAVRRTCADRAETERNKFVKEAFLDLIHVKEIIESNWNCFESAFRSVGWGGSKAKALSWFAELNDIRKLVMHPARRHFTGHTVRAGELEFLTGILQKVEMLVAGRASN